MVKVSTTEQMRAEWSKPEVTSLGQDLTCIENSFAPGVDALMFGLMTSMS